VFSSIQNPSSPNMAMPCWKTFC